MMKDALVKIKFLPISNKIESHFTVNIELLFILYGDVDIEIGKDIVNIPVKEFMIINSEREYRLKGSENAFICQFIISYERLCEALNTDIIMLGCSSMGDSSTAVYEIRETIMQILNVAYQGRTDGDFLLEGLYYKLIHLLVSNTRITAQKDGGEKSDDRMQSIRRYVERNYRNNISLGEMADHLYLSKTYLSKYIKKQFGCGFVELVNKTRLCRSIEEVLYTEDSIMKIAMDYGFPSVAAYNKVFKDEYGKTPSKYRKDIGVTGQKFQEIDCEREKKAFKYIEELLEYTNQEEHLVKPKMKHDIRLDRENLSRTTWNNACNALINVGTANDLTKASFQKHVLFMKSRINIRYVRVWDIFNPELYLDPHSSGRNYGRLYEVIDFLVRNNLKPYIELGFKPISIRNTSIKSLKEIRRDPKFRNDEELRRFYADMLQNLIKAYGEEEIGTWLFEVWKPDENVWAGEGFQSREYCRFFDKIAGAFRDVMSGVQIGSGGLNLYLYGKTGISELFAEWRNHKQHPCFIALNSFPYELKLEDGEVFEKKLVDEQFVYHDIQIFKELMHKSGFDDVNLFVAEYGISLSNRNVVNDSIVNAAYLVKNALHCSDQTDILGYWMSTDNYADLYDTQTILFGGGGLVTKMGIPKTAFYAMEFLNNLYPVVVAKDEHTIITHNNRDSFKLVCHNQKNLNYNYYSVKEDELEIKRIPYMHNDAEYFALKLTITNVNNGIYIVKKNQVDDKIGNIQYEWLRLNLEPELDRREQDYLKQINTPRISLSKIEVSHNKIEIETILRANEIQYIHVTKRQ